MAVEIDDPKEGSICTGSWMFDGDKHYLFYTVRMCDGSPARICRSVSEDLTEWRELDEPLYIAPEGMGEPECPDYFYKDGFYYLVYSLHGTGYYQYSKMPFTHWQIADDPIIPCKSVPKAAIWNDRLIFTGFDGNGKYGGTMTFLEAVVEKDGQLRYKSLA